MIQTTTPGVDGRTITEYLGVVTGEAILGANIVRDLFAGIRDIVGGRSGAYEEEFARRARSQWESSKRKPPRAARMPWWGSISTTRRWARAAAC